jgi:hypothetical protein
MSHARQQIREAFATRITGLASSATVYQWRARAVPPTIKKALRVSTPEESTDLNGELGDAPSRLLQIRVEVIVRQADDVDDVVDQLCVEVEEAVATDETLGGLLLWCRPSAFEADVLEESAETEMQGALTFEAMYSVALTDVETII